MPQEICRSDVSSRLQGYSNGIKRSVCEEPPGYRGLLFPDYTYYMVFSFPGISEIYVDNTANMDDMFDVSLSASALSLIYGEVSSLEDFELCTESNASSPYYGLCEVSVTDMREASNLEDFHIYAISLRIDSSDLAPGACESSPCTLILKAVFDDTDRRRMLAEETGGDGRQSSTAFSSHQFTLPSYEITITMDCRATVDILPGAVKVAVTKALGCNNCAWMSKRLSRSPLKFVIGVRSLLSQKELQNKLLDTIDLSEFGIASSCLDVRVLPLMTDGHAMPFGSNLLARD